jgi:DNA topoisomerase VI subunit B
MSTNSHRLSRQTFNLLEFCSRKELELQTGHTADLWALVTAKELGDNGLDACEEAGIAPLIEFIVTTDQEQTTLGVRDNGPGIAPETVASILNFDVRVSSREAYASPTRGAQGNALKTIIAMPYALDDSEEAATTIEARGIRHEINLAVDAVRQKPVITHDQAGANTKDGTSVTVRWPISASSHLAAQKIRFLQFALSYGILNPHAAIRVTWNGEVHDFPASDRDWTKWSPSDPTCAHWYDVELFERLVAAYAHAHADRTVREFITEFRGLKGSAKVSDVLQTSDLARVSLGDLFDRNGKPRPQIRHLLATMKMLTNKVKPADLGIIGEANLENQFEQLGAAPSSFQYKRICRVDSGVPTIIEAAFAYAPDQQRRLLITGVNWSPAIFNPFRQLGSQGESLERVLAGQFAESGDPIIVAVHLASPVISYLDRGKGSIALRGTDTPEQVGPDEKEGFWLPEVFTPDDGSLAADLISAVKAVTKRWSKQRLAEVKDDSRRAQRRDAMARSLKVPATIAAAEIMEKAYLKASAGGTLPANARQIMYAARPYIQKRTGKQLNDTYFTQTLLPNYLTEHKPDWTDKVAYDDRGHFTEPHTGRMIGLGTLSVQDYLRRDAAPVPQSVFETRIETNGPAGRYGGLLFIEKEGFDALFDEVNLRERYDLALMSTKGISVTAARRLADSLCYKHNIPLFVLRDFDKAGFTGVGTFRKDNRRYKYENRVNVIDLGLRLDDVRALGLEGLAEDAFDKGDEDQRRANLIGNGATEEEVDFLLTKRVELNALTSDQLVELVEEKLKGHGVRKLVPKRSDLAEAYRVFKRGSAISEIVKAEIAKSSHIDVPGDLTECVQDYLNQNPELPWDEALRHIVSREAGRL